MLRSFGGSPDEKIDRTFRPLAVDHLQKILAFHADRCVAHIPSHQFVPEKPIDKAVRYKGKMQEREAAARAEADRRKTQVAPIYNKGPATYIAGYDPKDLGKKT